jgi:hypothetical protein
MRLFKCAFHWKTLVAAVMYSQLNSIILDYPFCRVVAIIVSYSLLCFIKSEKCVVAIIVSYSLLCFIKSEKWNVYTDKSVYILMSSMIHRSFRSSFWDYSKISFFRRNKRVSLLLFWMYMELIVINFRHVVCF